LISATIFIDDGVTMETRY